MTLGCRDCDLLQSELDALREGLEAEVEEQRAAVRAATDLRDRARADRDTVGALVHDEWRTTAQALADRLTQLLQEKP